MRVKLFPFVAAAALSALLAASANEVTHTLERGETLFGLSRKYGVSAEAIMQANGITNPDKIRAGEALKIPLAEGSSAAPSSAGARGSFTYVVEKGDSLYGLSRRFDVSVQELAAANGLERDAQLKIGDKLSIPQDTPQGGSARLAQDSSAFSSTMEDPRTYEKKKVDSSVIWPVDAQDVAYLTGKIYGVSITASQGSNVKNIASGTVLSIGPYRGFGQVVFVQSGEGYIYVYGGLENIGVKSSDRLSFGDSLGTLGFDPLSGKSQLYFMVYKKDFPVDPATAPRG